MKEMGLTLILFGNWFNITFLTPIGLIKTSLGYSEHGKIIIV